MLRRTTTIYGEPISPKRGSAKRYLLPFPICTAYRKKEAGTFSQNCSSVGPVAQGFSVNSCGSAEHQNGLLRESTDSLGPHEGGSK